MKLTGRISFLVFPALAACLVLALQGCKTEPVVIPPDLSPAETFQRAQDAAESGNYGLAIRYYSAFRQSHPENKDRDVWAQYEIAFNYHKMGNNKLAVSLLALLLQEYQTSGDTLPPAPRILAQNLKNRLSEMTAPASPPAAPGSTTADTPPQ